MIISKIRREETKENYPILKELNGKIILFCRENCGVLLRDRENREYEGPHKIGDFYTEWTEDMFKVYHGSVTIQNEISEAGKAVKQDDK